MSYHSHSNSEQGRQNDLIKNSCKASLRTIGTHPVGGDLGFDDYLLCSGISKSDHYPPSIHHSRVLRGSSCHAVTVTPANNHNLEPLLSNDVQRAASKAWFHVYSNRQANCSRRTQCAAVAYLTEGVSSAVRYRQLRRAEKKLRKQQRLVHEVVPSSDQVTFSSAYIDQEIIVLMEVIRIVL